MKICRKGHPAILAFESSENPEIAAFLTCKKTPSLFNHDWPVIIPFAWSGKSVTHALPIFPLRQLGQVDLNQPAPRHRRSPPSCPASWPPCSMHRSVFLTEVAELPARRRLFLIRALRRPGAANHPNRGHRQNLAVPSGNRFFTHFAKMRLSTGRCHRTGSPCGFPLSGRSTLPRGFSRRLSMLQSNTPQ